MEFVSPREAWESFYVIVGTSAAALIGIQFVVVALIADRRKAPSLETVNAFATPTVVHLAMVLAISAAMSAPWTSAAPLLAALALCGVGGLAYGVIVIQRARRQSGYAPVASDWVWYLVAPCAAYAAILAAALVWGVALRAAVFTIGTASFALLLVAIRNAWDTVLDIAVTRRLHDDVAS